MLKKISILFSSLILCIILSCASVFALDFEKLPSGIDVSSLVPDGYEVIQTGETTNGVVYIVSAVLTNNADGANLSPYLGAINIIGFSRADGTIAYSKSYTQAGSYPKISAKSKNYFYYVNSTNIAKIDLNTGLVSGTLNGSIPTTGIFTTPDAQTITAKFIAVNEHDEVYILGKRSDSVVRIECYNGTAWVDFITGPFPSPNSTGTPNAFCATLDSSGNKICYSAFGSTLYKSNSSTHTTCTGTPSGTYYGVSLIAGINAGDAIFAFYSSSNGYVYYCNGTTAACTQSLAAGGSYFTNKYYNLVYINDGDKASFSFWNTKYATYSIDGSGTALPVQAPSNATQALPLSVKNLNGTLQPKSTDLAHLGSTANVILDGNKLSWGSLVATGHTVVTYVGSVYSNWLGTCNEYTLTHEGSTWYLLYYNSSYYSFSNNNFATTSSTYYISNSYYTDGGLYGNSSYIPTHFVAKQSITLDQATDLTEIYTVLGAFGTRTMNSWIITSTTAPNATTFNPFKTLSQVIASSGTVTYTTTSNPTPVTTPASYALTVLKGVAFKEVISDDVLGTSTAPSGNITFTRKSASSGSTTLYYTVASGTLSDADIDAATSTKAVVVNGKLVVFKVVAPPTSSATAATIQFN